MEFRSLKYLKVAFFSLCLLLGSPVTNAQTASDSIKIHQTRYYNGLMYFDAIRSSLSIKIHQTRYYNGISETMRSADLDREPNVGQ